MLIQTEDGSIYTVDTTNNVIAGGILPRPVQYASAMLIVGRQGIIYLRSGVTIPLGLVVRYC